MLISGPDLNNTPVLSLQTGGELARTGEAIINPHNLSVIAYEVQGPKLDQNPSFLRIKDVREFGTLGMIIDSSEEFVGLGDIITLKDVYSLRYKLIGKAVVDEKRDKVGKVLEYNLDSDSFMIEQITIKRPLLKSFNDGELIVHRSQIVEVTDFAIVIKSKAEIPKGLPKSSQNYVNPFRKSPQAETITSDSHPH